MPNILVDGINFDFPAKWVLSKYDEWIFYKKFAKMWNGIKAVDVVAYSPDNIAWLIEVKDYRHHKRTKTIDLGGEVAQKVFDTLAALPPAQANALNDDEKSLASHIVNAKKIRVVLHLEQPGRHSKLFPRAIDPANIQMKLRKILKPIDPHPLVTESRSMQNVPWAMA